MIRAMSLFLPCAAGLLAIATTSVIAQPVETRADYSVSLVGLPVAYLSFVTQVDDKSYRISGSMRTSPLSDIISKTRGNASVSGKLVSDRMVATSFTVAYSSGKHSRRTDIEFRDGNVKSAVNSPERKEKSADWVPLSPEDLRAVLDPLSGLVLPAKAVVCPRSLAIFDGQSRVTLHLTHKGIRPFRTKGFAGDAIACTVRFEPKSGYRKGSSAIEYLRKLKTMEVWFAKNPIADFYAPVYVKVPTTVGQVVVSATRYGS